MFLPPSKVQQRSGHGAALLAIGTMLLAGSANAQVPASSSNAAQEQVAPALAGYTRTVLFGEVWKRPQLAPRDRSMITVAALIASGGSAARMRSHINLALENGLKPREISGIITHLAFYSGWPNAVDAVEVANEIFQKRGITPDQVAPLTGQTAPQLTDQRAAEVKDRIGSFAPGLADYTVNRLYGEVWRSPDLKARDRSMVTVAALIAMGSQGELPSHVNRALNNGVTKVELAEMLTHLAFYVGWPKVMSATPIVDQVIKDREQSQAAVTPPATGGLRVIHRSEQTPERAPAEQFVGEAMVQARARPDAPAKFRIGIVNFKPKARTAWHAHILGQMLVVTSGHGFVQAEGGPLEAVGPGDIIWTPAGVRHWHGAAPDAPMSHVAIAEGDKVDWGAKLSDDEYASAIRQAGKPKSK